MMSAIDTEVTLSRSLLNQFSHEKPRWFNYSYIACDIAPSASISPVIEEVGSIDSSPSMRTVLFGLSYLIIFTSNLYIFFSFTILGLATSRIAAAPRSLLTSGFTACRMLFIFGLRLRLLSSYCSSNLLACFYQRTLSNLHHAAVPVPQTSSHLSL